MKKVWIWVCFVLLGFSLQANAALLKNVPLGNASFSIGGNLRFRYEYQNNFNVKTYANTKDNYILERFRLNIHLKTQKGLETFIQFQDTHCLDCALKVRDFKGKCPYVNEMDVRQAYLEWRKIDGSPFGFKAGRQQINYRDNRVFGPGQWGNVGRYTWDALMFKYEGSYLDLDAFFAKRIFYRPKAFLDEHYPYDVYALYGKIKHLPVSLDVFCTFKFNRADKDKYGILFKKEQRHTFGVYFKGKQPLYGKNHFLTYSGLYAYQTGCYPGRGSRISAYGWYANLGLHFTAFIPQAFWVRYSYGSGDKDPNDNKFQTFDGIFGAIDKYFGRMNMLCWKNLKDYQLTYQLKPIKGLKITIDHHWFYLAQREDYWYYANGKPARDVSATGSDYLGREWDGFAVYDMNKHLQFQLGICRFLPGTALVKSGFHEKTDYIIFQTFIKF